MQREIPVPVPTDYISQGRLSYTIALLPWQTSCTFANMNIKATCSLSSCLRASVLNFSIGYIFPFAREQRAAFIIHNATFFLPNLQSYQLFK